MVLPKPGINLALSPLGLGCMGMSEFYGSRDDKLALQTLEQAVEMGINFFDTADTYGPYHNEELLGQFLKNHRHRVHIASKFGIVRKPGEYQRTLNNSPEYARKSCEASLRRLGVEQIDLYYVHRLDPHHPVEETMAGLIPLVQEGKIGRIGLCEVSAATLRRAHAVHPIAAVQTEYSLWTRDVEAEALPTCRELGISLVAYSPLGRGFLTGRFQHDATFEEGDFRSSLPRFQPGNIDANRALVNIVTDLAAAKGCSPAQVALAWLLAQGNDIIPIPGTKRITHLQDNLGALSIQLEPHEMAMLYQALDTLPIVGERYTAEGMKGVNS